MEVIPAGSESAVSRTALEPWKGLVSQLSAGV